LTAWDKSEVEEKRDDEDEKKTFNSSYEIIVDYSEYSTIQGFIYIFFSYQTLFGRIFWIIVILAMLILGLYWCIKAYLDWQEKPVLTTITTTAYSVKQVKMLLFYLGNFVKLETPYQLNFSLFCLNSKVP
jgi:hypothetical protein